MSPASQAAFQVRLLELTAVSNQLTAHSARDVPANARAGHNALTHTLTTQKTLAAEPLNLLRQVAKPFFGLLCVFADGLHLTSDAVLTSISQKDLQRRQSA